jgi:hypothetical protein
MKLRGILFDELVWSLLKIVHTRNPDFIIGGKERPYMLRWWLTPWSKCYRDIPDTMKTRWQWFVSRLPGVYLHYIMRSDDDRALHDHPWRNVSILLRGSYVEHTIEAGGIHKRVRCVAGDVVFRKPLTAHRLEIDSGPCVSLFLCGFRVRSWGFHCPNGWVDWKDFTAPDDAGAIGKGCGQ